ncbi:MAG: hypothetical protein JWQ30_1093 [Sediminibacterium sp.]|nr:hypothetical protein [Sediminibacterium sp.]
MKHLGGDGSPLRLPLSSVGMSENFTRTALEHGYNTLYEFQRLSIGDLLEMKWFTGSMFKELAEILKKLYKLAKN